MDNKVRNKKKKTTHLQSFIDIQKLKKSTFYKIKEPENLEDLGSF